MIEDNKNFEISLGELVSAIWRGRYIIFTITVLTSLYSVWYSLSLPNIYKSSAILIAQDSSSKSNVPSSLESFAGFAGINLNENKVDNTSLAIEVMQSFKFFKDFNEKHDILIPLMATIGWDKASDELIYDSNIYDIKKKKWIKSESNIPSLQKAHKIFINSMSIAINKDNGVITLSIEHLSPKISKSWVDLLIKEVNSNIKNRDVQKAESSIKLLTQEVAKTEISQIADRLYFLIQSQIETIILAQTNEEYIFQTIDPAISPELKSSPNRSLICIIGALFGFIFGSCVSLLRHFSFI